MVESLIFHVVAISIDLFDQFVSVAEREIDILWLYYDWYVVNFTFCQGETTISVTDDIGHNHIGHTKHHIGHKQRRYRPHHIGHKTRVTFS